jgi:hypothetical protein
VKEKAQKKSSKKADLLRRIRDRYKVMSEADQENRRLALEDLKFANEPGAQWDENMRKERGNRPCFEFNKVRINGKRVINEIRANRPQGKVRAVEGGDKKTAELYEGLCRNIANSSDFDTVTDQAAEYQVDAGMAAWRVTTEYSHDTAFEQDIIIKPFKNPFCVYVDPACQDVLKRDAEDWIVTERISKRSFESRWPDAEPVEFEESVEFDDQDEWADSETIRICEYWYKEPADKEIWLIQGPNGPMTIDAESDEARGLKAQGVTPIRTRIARTHKIKMCIASGDAILEEADWAGAQFPFVMVYGEYKVVDGEVKWWGLHRFAKDAQKSYNINRTSCDETVAGAPKEYFWATPEQARGHTELWAEAHKKNFPYKLYNPDPKNGGAAPQRAGGVEIPAALMAVSQMAAQDLRDVTGLHETSFGQESGEKSGIAIARKQNQAQLVTYNFPDNISKGVRRTWEILIDLIPRIYDSERELRVIGADGAEDYAKVNTVVMDPATGRAVRVNDLSVGKYDVTVTTGPSFSTQRQEAAEIYGELGSRNPALMQVAGDLVFKAMDLPYADEVAKRWQSILPPAIQQQINEGKSIPPEAQAAMAQVAQAMQIVQQQTQMIQAAAQEVEQGKAEAEKARSQVDVAISNLKTQEAQFSAMVEKEMAKIVKAQADLTLREAQSSVGQAQTDATNDRASLSTEVQQAVLAIQQMAAEFQQQSLATLAEIMAKQQTQVFVPPQPKPVRIRARRVNGELVAEPEYETAPTGIQ